MIGKILRVNSFALIFFCQCYELTDDEFFYIIVKYK